MYKLYYVCSKSRARIRVEQMRAWGVVFREGSMSGLAGSGSALQELGMDASLNFTPSCLTLPWSLL